MVQNYGIGIRLERLMLVTRRRLVVNIAGLGVGFALPSFQRNAHAAVDPATAAAAISLGREVLNAFKRGGEIDREFAAVNVRLAAILANQEALANGLGMMSAQVAQLQKLVANIPAETQGLGLLQDASSLARQSASFVAGNTPRTSKEWREQRATYRQRVVQLSFDLSVAPTILQYEPSIALATRQALHALQMVALAEGDLQRLPPNTADEYRNAVENLRGVFEVMSANPRDGVNNLTKRIADLEALIAEHIKTAANAPFAPLANVVLPGGVTSQSGNDAPAKRSMQVCLMSPVQSKVTRFETIRDFVSETKMAVIGFVTDSLDTRHIVKVANETVATRLYGGKDIYQVTRAPSSRWPRDTYSKRWRHLKGSLAGPREQVLSEDPVAKIHGCVEALDAESGAPSLYGAFDAYLAKHAALVALQSRLISFRDLSVKSIDICNSLDAKLKK